MNNTVNAESQQDGWYLANDTFKRSFLCDTSRIHDFSSVNKISPKYTSYYSAYNRTLFEHALHTMSSGLKVALHNT